MKYGIPNSTLAVAMILAPSLLWANPEQTTITHVITSLSEGDNQINVDFQPHFQNNQNCGNDTSNTFVMDQSQDQGNALYTALLAATVSQRTVGFSIDGCLGNSPKLTGLHIDFASFGTQASVDTSPVDTSPVDTSPVDTSPVDTSPVDTSPVDTSPVDTSPVDTSPVDTSPVDTSSTNSISTWRSEQLPDVTFNTTSQGIDNYQANVTDNSNNKTLHYHNNQGRFDGLLTSFPFDAIVRNAGIGDINNPNTYSMSLTGNEFTVTGVQVHSLDPNSPNAAHIVVGHRGNDAYTIEAKSTLNGNSQVSNEPHNSAPQARADLRIVGNEDRTLTLYWQLPNSQPGIQADQWQLYKGDGQFPGTLPSFENQVYVGLISYGYDHAGIPFTATIDSLIITTP